MRYIIYVIIGLVAGVFGGIVLHNLRQSTHRDPSQNKTEAKAQIETWRPSVGEWVVTTYTPDAIRSFTNYPPRLVKIIRVAQLETTGATVVWAVDGDGELSLDGVSWQWVYPTMNTNRPPIIEFKAYPLRPDVTKPHKPIRTDV